MGDRFTVPIVATTVALALALGLAVATFSVLATAVLFFALVASMLTLVVSRGSTGMRSSGRDLGSSLRTWAKWVFLSALLTSSLTIIRLPGGFTLSDWMLALAAGLLALAAFRTKEPVSFSPTAPILIGGILLLTLGGMLSAAMSEHVYASLAVLLRVLVTTTALAWLSGAVLNNGRDLLNGLKAWCGSVALGATGAVVALTSGWIAPEAIGERGRYSGFTQHPNELGAMCAIAMPVAIFLVARKSARTPERLAASTILVLIGIGGLLSGSVTFVLSAALGILTLAILTRFKLRYLIPIALIPLVALLIASTLSLAGVETPFNRFDFRNPTGDTKGNTLQARELGNAAALNAIRASPAVGTGFGEGLTSDYKEVHNILLQSWFEGGAFAALGILLILLTYAIRAYVSTRAAPRRGERHEMSSALAASFVAFLLFSAAALLIYKRFAWISPALVSANYLVLFRGLQRSPHAGIDDPQEFVRRPVGPPPGLTSATPTQP